MRANLVVFLQGVCAGCAGAIGVFFLRFWRDTADRLFGLFAGAFWLMAASWALIAVGSPTDEYRPYVYGLRLLAFSVIIVAVVDKNRQR